MRESKKKRVAGNGYSLFCVWWYAIVSCRVSGDSAGNFRSSSGGSKIAVSRKAFCFHLKIPRQIYPNL